VLRIVQRLGGNVGVESRVNEGSIFWFTLPAASDEEAAQLRGPL
jgi:signal transduction histidine kinase